MASRALGADELREKHRWGDATKVYTRWHFRGGLKNIHTASIAVDIINDSTAVEIPSDTAASTTVDVVNDTTDGTAVDIPMDSMVTIAGDFPSETTVTIACDIPNDLTVSGDIPDEAINGVAVYIVDDIPAIADVETVNDTMVPDAISYGDTIVSSTITVLVTSDHINNMKDGNQDSDNNHVPHESLETIAIEDANSPKQQRSFSPLYVVSDDSSSHNRSAKVPNGRCERLTSDRNGCITPLVSRVDNRVRFNLGANVPKCDLQELKRKLLRELAQVRNIIKRLDEKDIQVSGSSIDGATVDYFRPRHSANGLGKGGRTLFRVHSEVGSVHQHDSRPFRQLSISVMENSHVTSEFVEKDKRTPKAHQYYLNSEFFLTKDRLLSESNKKSKSSRGKKHGRQKGYGFGVDKNTNQALKSCTSLVARLLKHKYGWVFEKPVDVESLGLHDYHDIITNPMDLGTIKNKLSSNWYKTPLEFAEDVRLTFNKAYNPKGQDVHLMAEEIVEDL